MKFQKICGKRGLIRITSVIRSSGHGIGVNTLQDGLVHLFGSLLVVPVKLSPRSE